MIAHMYATCILHVHTCMICIHTLHSQWTRYGGKPVLTKREARKEELKAELKKLEEWQPATRFKMPQDFTVPRLVFGT